MSLKDNWYFLNYLASRVPGFVTTSIGQSHSRHGYYFYIYPSVETVLWKERGGEIEGMGEDGGEYEAQLKFPKEQFTVMDEYTVTVEF